MNPSRMPALAWVQPRSLRPGQLSRALAACTLVFVACTGDGPAGPTPPGSALRFADLEAGYYHTCGLTRLGTAYCWGGNDFGTLGDGTRTLRSQPARVAGTVAFASLDAGAGHNCALSNAGVAWCWGQNDEGQLGDASFLPRDAPVAVTGGRTFVRISAGHAHSCAVASDGSAWCWGDDSRGQLGNGVDENARSSVPVRVLHNAPFAHVIAGYYQTCALDRAGSAFCWGGNESGQLGSGGTDDSHVPAAVMGSRAFTELAPGDRFVCGISEGATWCWGANRDGELGTDAGAAGSTVPVPLSGAPPTRSVFTSMGASTINAADAYGCVVSSNDAALCWGGDIRALRAADADATPLDPRIRFRTMAVGAQHVCGLSTDGYAYCGGANYSGQVGDGTRTDRPQLVAIPGPL